MPITNPPQFSYQTAAPTPPVKRTLNDYRINPVDYAALAASKANNAVKPGWVVALAVVAIGAGAFAVNQRGGFVSKHESVPQSVTPASLEQTVPAATTVTAPAPAAPEATARDSAASAPLAPLTKSSETTEMPKALHGNNHSSDSLQAAPAPKAAKSSATKPAPAKKIAEPLVAPTPVNNQVTPPVEAVPPATTPQVAEPTPPAPTPPTPAPQPEPKPEPAPN